MKHKILSYAQFYWLPVVLVIVAGWFWYKFTDTSTFRQALLAAIFGVGITVAIAHSDDARKEHSRLKRSLAILKYTTTTYFKNQSENITKHLDRFNDITMVSEAEEALDFFMRLDAISSTYVRDWTQLMYSSDFIACIKTDEQLGRIYNAINEQNLVMRQLTWQSVNAQSFVNLPGRTPERTINIARGMGDELRRANEIFIKAIDRLDDEIDDLMAHTGVTYQIKKRY